MFRLYSFDLDDNLVTTDSCIRTDKGRIPTREYAAVRGTVRLAEDAFVELRKVDCCELVAAPCLSVLERAVEDGSPIAVVTARDNSAAEMRRLLGRALAELGKVKLPEGDAVRFYCCNSKEFLEAFEAEGKSIEERKCLALKDFLTHHPDATSIGFSDDDEANLRTAGTFFESLGAERPELKCALYEATPDGRVKRRKLG